MWFMNLIWNPIMKLILNSPLHGLFSEKVLLFTYQGRKSGKEFSLPVQYARKDEIIYIVVGMADRKTWWKNLRGGVTIQLLLQQKKLNARAEVLASEARREEMADALGLYVQKFPEAAGLYRLNRLPDGTFQRDDLLKAVTDMVMVRAQLAEA